MSTTEKTLKLVNEHRIYDAFRYLRGKASTSAQNDKLLTLEQTYKYMIHYLVEGTPDDSRSRMLESIKLDLLDLAQDIEREHEAAESGFLYFNTLRTRRLAGDSIPALADAFAAADATAALAQAAGNYDAASHRERERLLRDLFMAIWTSEHLSPSDASRLRDIMLDEEKPLQLRAQIISALMLALSEYYDKAKLTALLDAYEAGSLPENLAARVLTAIVVAIAVNRDRVVLDSGVMARLSLWQDDILIYSRLRCVIMNIIRTRQTDKLDTKMREELLPELMKLRPEIMKRFRDLPKETDASEFEENPEWEEFMNKSGLAGKLQELNEIQMEGGDVMMTSFSNLKGFSFFRELPNWFLPYSSDYSELTVAREMPEGLGVVLSDHNPMMCNSDKFSFALSLQQMPKAQMDMITGQWKAQMDQMQEELKSSLPKDSRTFDNEVTSFVRDMFRFYRLFRLKNEFPEPFSKVYDFMGLPGIGDTVTDSDTLALVGEFYFRNSFYEDALSFFQRVAESREQPDAHLCEKIGYCYQSLGDREKAIEHYTRAELLQPGSEWLRKKLAHLYRAVGQPAKAAEYYARLLETDPDSVYLLTNAAHALLEAGDVEGALKHFYKVHYLAPDKTDALRAIAWGELLMKNYDKSRALFEEILIFDPTPGDYLNAGHLAMLERKMKEAVAMYREARRNWKGGAEEFAKAYQEDIPSVSALNPDIPEEVFYLVLDNMRYE